MTALGKTLLALAAWIVILFAIVEWRYRRALARAREEKGLD